MYISRYLFFSTFLMFFLVPNCAPIYTPSSQEALSAPTIKTLISRIQEQDKKVSSFYSIGRIWVKDWGWESESNILIVGTKSPFKIKIEITHSWGRPIMHILMDNMSLRVLSFTENRLYIGTMAPETLSRFFPGEFSPDLIWAVLRGYPHLIRHHRIASLRANQISLFNLKEEEVEMIDFYPENRFPQRASFPERHLNVAYSGFQEDGGIYYAREVRVNSMKGRRRLLLKNRNMVFNKPIPGQIFILEKPPMFETVNLDTAPRD